MELFLHSLPKPSKGVFTLPGFFLRLPKTAKITYTLEVFGTRGRYDLSFLIFYHPE